MIEVWCPRGIRRCTCWNEWYSSWLPAWLPITHQEAAAGSCRTRHIKVVIVPYNAGANAATIGHSGLERILLNYQTLIRVV